MQFTQAAALLDPTPLPLETGYERLADGSLHVACRTDLHGCTGAMFEWWFRSRPDTQRYIWWHPVDHISSEWEGELAEDTHVGSEHVVIEEFTGLPAADLRIQFRDAHEFFPPAAYDAARREGRISAAVLARIGTGKEPPRLADGSIVGGRLLHIGRDTPWGMALRSHFFVGLDLPHVGMSPADITAEVPDVFGIALLQHCYNEFTFLSRFLPSLFVAERPERRSTPVPW